MPTKPEGPAQEPQEYCPTCGSGYKFMYQRPCSAITSRGTDPWHATSPATPAPSQPAGARETARKVLSLLMPPKGRDWSQAANEVVADVIARHFAQQTAAKEAEHDKHIAEFQQAIYETCKAVALECGQPDHAIDGAGSDGDEIEFTVTEVKQAFNLLRESKVAAERERDSLREQLRTAEEAFDRMATCEDDESEEYVTAWDALGAALKAGKDGQQ